MSKRIDMTGVKFGRGVVLEFDSEATKRTGQAHWKCQCECGNVFTTSGYNIRSGKTLSCGCYRNEAMVAGKRSLADKKRSSIVGKKFGMLSVIELSNRKDTDGSFLWDCVCDCGKTVAVSSRTLLKTVQPNCGCLFDLTGRTFGKLTVLSKVDNIKKSKSSWWLCRCQCGNEKVISSNSLKKGTASCGCLIKEVATKLSLGKYKDISGQRFGNLTAISISKEYLEHFKPKPRCAVCELKTNYRGWISAWADALEE